MQSDDLESGAVWYNLESGMISFNLIESGAIWFKLIESDAIFGTNLYNLIESGTIIRLNLAQFGSI